MKIKQLYIEDYGPLKEKRYSFEAGFNLLYGLNEKGKSLTFDALVKLLLGKESKNFELINRVEDDPGQFGSFVSLHYPSSDLGGKSAQSGQNGQLKTVKLQGKTSLSELVGLNADECENLFLIRNSNLSIGKDLAGQDKFYTNLTDRLTGLKTEEISQLKDQLRDLAQITEKNDQFQNIQEGNHLHDRLDQAQALLSDDGKLSWLIKQNQSKQWSGIELEALQAQQRLKAIEQELNQLAHAKHQLDYQSAKQTLQELQKITTQLDQQQKITQQQIEKFKEHKRSIQFLEKSLQELNKEREDKQERLKAAGSSLEKTQTELAKQEKAQQQLKATEPRLNLIKQQLAQARSAASQRIWKLALLGSSTILILLIIAYIVSPAEILIFLMLAAGAATIFSGVKYYLQLQNKQKADSDLEKLKLDLAQYNIQGEEIEQLAQELEKEQQNYAALKDQETKLKMEKKGLEDDLSELKDKKISKTQHQINEHQQEIEQIKLTCKVDSWQKLQAQWEQKQKLQTRLQELSAVLEEKLGRSDSAVKSLLKQNNHQPDLIKNKIRIWEKRLEEMAAKHQLDLEQVNEADQSRYSPKTETKLKQEQIQLMQAVEEKEQQLSGFKQQARDLEREVNDILIDRTEPILCETMADILQAKQELDIFIEHHYQLRQNALDVIKILNKIQQQEKQKVGQLFGEDSSISRHFAAITNNRYSQVFFDQETNQVKVEDKSSQVFTPRQLSAGTYDQLYFAIRLGLGQKLLDEKTGFFIMDDPFIKADKNRLKQQLDMLLDLSKKGWQVIYFTAKKEVEDYLADKAGKIFEL